jgi:hypothetical protein
MTKEEGHLGSVFLPSSTEVNFLVDEKAHQRCRPRRIPFSPQFPAAMVIRIIFMRVFFSIVAQSYFKIGRCDRQEGSSILAAFQTDGCFFKAQKKIPPKKFFRQMAILNVIGACPSIKREPVCSLDI